MPAPHHLVRIAALVCLAALGGCDRWSAKVWVEEQRELRMPAGGLTRLEIETHNGALSATGEEGAAEIVVVAKVRGGGESTASAQACLAAIELVSETDGGVHRLGWRYSAAKAADWNSEVAFRVTLPPGVEISAQTHNGAIEIAGMTAACDLETHNGRIRVDAGAGPLVAETHNGAIDVRTRAGRIDLTTHNGAVEVAALGAGPLGGSILTHNGRVRLGLIDGISTDLSCETANGKIHVNVPWEASVTKKTQTSGRVGTGGAALEVETHNGTISVDRIQAEAS
jgi:DUF4097 and DUF4098 domain-containing protein YvlB